MGALFQIDELADIVSGHWVKEFQQAGEFELATDNRLDCCNKIFIALRGALFDAHQVVQAVAEQGAAALIVNASAAIALDKLNLPILAVEDTLTAYQMLARHYRRRIRQLQLVAVTGSVGKTSTKELLRAIGLAEFAPDELYATTGNTNNQFGVPQNLLQLPENCRYAVIEMGTNHFGEIAPLSCCAEPEVALVNSIAPCHLEYLQSLAGVAKEKSEIFRFLNPAGVAVIPEYSAENQILRRAAAKFTTFTFGDEAELLQLPVAENSRRVVAQVLQSDLIGNEMSLTFMNTSGVVYCQKLYLPLSGPH
ncbi:MAG: UDP-N-acetylmuramoyl-tripeptide--D-alanyl-D-alanine ligase, partial [Victivallaceae bacterium]